MGADLSSAIRNGRALMAGAAPAGGPPGAVQVWIEEVREGDDALVAHEVRPYRDLLQLRRPLPAPPSGLDTRAFDPARDMDEFITVNNRAFAWHPEQAGLSRERAMATMDEAWFDADGFRILERDGRIAGFCWTKVHHNTVPVLGEIYVIAVDPDFHGRGLGSELTLAGLDHLTSLGIDTAMLYVDASNEAAVAMYRRLGFEVHSTNAAFVTDVTGRPGPVPNRVGAR